MPLSSSTGGGGPVDIKWNGLSTQRVNKQQINMKYEDILNDIRYLKIYSWSYKSAL